MRTRHRDNPSQTPQYPRRDTCRRCGAHLGWVMSPRGEALAIGVCDRCAARTRVPSRITRRNGK
jgi:ribosomal protein L40E